MKKSDLLLNWALPFFLSLLLPSFIYAQCGSCNVTLPANIQPINDTLHLDTLRNPMKNQPYDEVLNFRLAQTMGPVAALDPTGQADPFKSASISRFAVTNISNLPPGLDWQGTPGNLSFTGSNLGDRDGCIRVCGTPTVQGRFTIRVDVELDLLFNGIPINNQRADFPLEVEVLPDSNASFEIVGGQLEGCSPWTVTVLNRLPSNGDPDLSYVWDFGNGQSSTLENPDSVVFTTTSGDTSYYTITHNTIRQTGVLLTSMVLTATACEDAGVFGVGASPVDMFVSVEDSSGNTVFSTDRADHTNTDPPIDFAPNSVLLDHNSVHTAILKDDDKVLGIGSDEDCGSIVLDLSPGSHVTSAGGSTLEYTIVPVYDSSTSTIEVLVRDCTPVKEIEKISNSLRLFPNPSKGRFELQFFVGDNKERIHISMRDVLGRVVLQRTIKDVQGWQHEHFDLQEQAEGLYLLQLDIDQKTITQKLLIQN